MLQFFDAVGNPLPAGILVSLVDDHGSAAGSAYTTAGGACDLSPSVGIAYTASFVGVFAPKASQVFILGVPPAVLVDGDGVPFVDGGSEFVEGGAYLDDGNRDVTVSGYASPVFSQAGFADKLYYDQPRRWYPADKADAPTLYTTLWSIAAALVFLEAGEQAVIGKERLHSSVDSDIDTWANDFIGFGLWSRAPGESNSAYIARVSLWCSTESQTDHGIQTLLQAWMNAWGIGILNPQAVEGFSHDNLGAFDDARGAFDNAGQPLLTQPPQVVVFDWQSNPQLSQAVGLQKDVGQFCVMLYYAGIQPLAEWYAGQSFVGVDAFLAQSQYYSVPAFTADFDRIVQMRKAQGTWPVYFSNKAP